MLQKLDLTSQADEPFGPSDLYTLKDSSAKLSFNGLMQPCSQASMRSWSDSRRLGAKHHSVKSDVTFDLSPRTTGNEAKA